MKLFEADFLDEAGIDPADYAKAMLRAMGWNPDDPKDMARLKKLKYSYAGIYIYDTRTGERV